MLLFVTLSLRRLVCNALTLNNTLVNIEPASLTGPVTFWKNYETRGIILSLNKPLLRIII